MHSPPHADESRDLVWPPKTLLSASLGEREGARAMTEDPFEVDRLFATVSDESRAIESLGEVLARLEAVQEAKRRLAQLDPATRSAAIAVRHSRLGQS